MTKRSEIYVAVSAMVAALLFCWYIEAHTPLQPVDLSGAHAPRVGPADIYPPVPGVINATITQGNIAQNICNKNWSTKSERPPSTYTTSLKIKQLKQYGYKDTKTADFEEDHLISLELGGNPTDTNNLWPEPYTASVGDGGARTKDKVEDWLHTQVCAGKITLSMAQQEIATDWYKVYMDNLQGKYGSVEPVIDQDDQ